MAAEVTGAHVLVQNLIAQGVRRVFVIPGARRRGAEAGWGTAALGARRARLSRGPDRLAPSLAGV